MTHSEIDARLREWGRWVRVRPQQGHCFSIEHLYRRNIREGDTPTGWVDWLTTPPQVPSNPPRAFAALQVERTMRHLPGRHRRALKLHYVVRLPPRLCCRRLAIPYAGWEAFLDDSQSMVAALLTRQQSRRTVPPDVLTFPAPAAICSPVGAFGICGA